MKKFVLILAFCAVAATVFISAITNWGVSVFTLSRPIFIAAGIAFIGNIVIQKRITVIVVAITLLAAGIAFMIAYSTVRVTLDADRTLSEVLSVLRAAALEGVPVQVDRTMRGVLSDISTLLILTGSMMFGNIIRRPRALKWFGVLGIAIFGFTVLIASIIPVGHSVGFGLLLLGIALIYIALYWSIVCIYNIRHTAHKTT